MSMRRSQPRQPSLSLSLYVSDILATTALSPSLCIFLWDYSNHDNPCNHLLPCLLCLLESLNYGSHCNHLSPWPCLCICLWHSRNHGKDCNHLSPCLCMSMRLSQPLQPSLPPCPCIRSDQSETTIRELHGDSHVSLQFFLLGFLPYHFLRAAGDRLPSIKPYWWPYMESVCLNKSFEGVYIIILSILGTYKFWLTEITKFDCNTFPGSQSEITHSR